MVRTHLECHRAEIREHLGFRLATVADQQRLTSWLTVSVAHAERRPDRVREALLGKFRQERIEAPTIGRVQRMVRSALRTAEQTWTARICDRLDGPARARLLALIASTSDEDTNEGEGEQDGAEQAGATVLMAEYSPINRRGFFSALPFIGIQAGTLLAAGVFIYLGTLSSEVLLGWAWRIPFLFSLVLILIALFIRLRLRETPTFIALEKQEQIAEHPMREIFGHSLPSGRILGVNGVFEPFELGVHSGAWVISAPPSGHW